VEKGIEGYVTTALKFIPVGVGSKKNPNN